MITFLTTAKPFGEPTRTAQINALTSWKHLDPDVQVILFGQAEGAIGLIIKANPLAAIAYRGVDCLQVRQIDITPSFDREVE